MKFKFGHFFTAIGAVVLLSLATAAHADNDHLRTASNANWQEECSACHVAYPPRLLPRESWRAVMNGLDKHFGSDASMDPAVTREIAAFLERNAGRNRQASDAKPLLRITETRWFRHEHDEVSARTWNNPGVKSPANCAACHTRAGIGNYSEHDIRIPR